MLPSIPVSPLIQQSLSCASLLADITQKLNQQQSTIDTTTTATTTSSSSSSTLEQDAKAQRTRLDQLTQQMYAVRAVICHQWPPDALAKQIVIVDSQLFCHHGATALNDFHTYLVHSLAHQLIIANSYAAFDHAVRLAHCLSQYRDWNGLMAVVRCLALPAVQRLSTSSASPLCHDFPWVHHDDSTTTTTNDTSFAAYRQALRRSLLPLRPYRFDAQDRRWSDSIKKINHTTSRSSQDTSDKDMDATYTLTSSSSTSQHKKRQQPNQQQRILVAIPWLPPLLEAETEHDRDLLLTLCRYNRWPAQVDAARSLLLPTSPSSSSSPSTPSSTSSSSTSTPVAVSSTTMLYSTTSSSLSSLSPLHRNNNLPPILPPHSIVDLLSLGVGDLVLQHWLVSRTYLTLDQLLLSSQIAESDQDARTTSRLASSPPPTPPPQHLLQSSAPASPASSSASSSSSSSSADVATDPASIPPPETLQQDYDDGQDWRNQTIPYNDDDDDDDDNDDDDDDNNNNNQDEQNDNMTEDPWQQPNNRHSLHFVGTNDQLIVAVPSPPPPPPSPPTAVTATTTTTTKGQDMEIPSISVASSIPLSVTATTMPISQLDQLGTSTMYDGDGDDVYDDDDDDDGHVSERSIRKENNTATATTVPAAEIDTSLSQLHDDNSNNKDVSDNQSKHDVETEDDDTVSKVSSLSPPTTTAESVIVSARFLHHDSENTSNDQQAMSDVEIVVATSTAPVLPAAPMVDDRPASSPSIQPVSILTSEPQFDHNEHDDEQQPLPPPPPVTDHDETDSEQWTGYPGPNDDNNDDDDDDDEIWTGYPEPTTTTAAAAAVSSTDDDDDDDGHEEAESPHRSTPSEASEDEWKGYHATSEEAKWQAETILKVQQQEWQGYTLETLDEDELDSSTMMNGEFVKSRHARELVSSNNGTSV